MKKRTRFVAWLYILPSVLGLLFVALLLLLVVFGSETGTHSPLQQFVGRGASAILLFGIMLLILIPILPWIYLLKKRAWAWWLLSLYYGLGTLGAVLALTQRSTVDSIELGVYFVPAFLILITDPPENWRARSGRRRRRSLPKRRRSSSRRR